MHIEEDAGKSTHGKGGSSLVDYNRAGVPLLEIVSTPDMRTGRQASEYAAELRRIVRLLNVSNGITKILSSSCRFAQNSLRGIIVLINGFYRPY